LGQQVAAGACNGDSGCSSAEGGCPVSGKASEHLRRPRHSSGNASILTPAGKNTVMNSIIYIVGLIVIVLFVLGFFGLR
jgi:hypothetical protein